MLRLAGSGATEGFTKKRAPKLRLQTSFLWLVAAAEVAWISAIWIETIRAAVA